jgi:hypothetical protein
MSRGRGGRSCIHNKNIDFFHDQAVTNDKQTLKAVTATALKRKKIKFYGGRTQVI